MERTYLVCVDGRENHNKFYEAIQNDDGSIDVTYGRVGATATYHHYAFYEKDYLSLIKSKLAKGYKDTSATHYALGSEVKATIQKFDSVEDKYVADFVKEMFSRQLSIAKQNYQSVQGVTKQAVEMVRKDIDKIIYYASLPNPSGYKFEINNILSDIYTIIPRRMSNSALYFARKATPDELNLIIERETKILDSAKVVADRLDSYGQEIKSDKDVLDNLGLKIESISYEEEDFIEEKLGSVHRRYKQAFAVKNISTDSAFNKTIDGKDEKHKQTSLLFHGSPSKNWWSIVTNGLSVDKARNGMFGQGLYFAPKAQKSAGYMDTHSSYWRSGNADTGFIGLYEVNTGVPLYVDSTRRELDGNADSILKFLQQRGCDSVWAREGKALRNDEVIVYDRDNCQANVRYIVELYDREINLSYRIPKLNEQEKNELKNAFSNLEKTRAGKEYRVCCTLPFDNLTDGLKQKLEQGFGTCPDDEVRFEIFDGLLYISDGKTTFDMENGDLKFLAGQMKRAFFKSEKEFREFKDVPKEKGEER